MSSPANAPHTPARPVADDLDPRLARWFNRPRTRLNPETVRTAVHGLVETLTAHRTATAHLTNEPEPTLTLVEAERETTITLAALTDHLEHHRVPEVSEMLDDALWRWFNTRPVTDEQAASHGIALVDWHHRADRPTWKVVVVRPTGRATTWVPTLRTPRTHIIAAQAAALERATRLTITPAHSGEVTVWTYPFNPALSTAVLANPDRIQAFHAVASLEHLYAVITPDRPVAITDDHAATRLTAETSERHLVVPLANLHTIGWV